MSTPEEIRQARFEAYDETFEEMETRLKNLEKMVKKNLCSPDSEDSFCTQLGGKRKKRRRKSRKKKRKTNKKKRKRKRKTKRKRRR